MKPDLVIIRVPSEEGDDSPVVLAEFDFIDGQLAAEGRTFRVAGDDWYFETQFDHLILAQKIEGGSTHAVRIVIKHQFDAIETLVYDIDHEELQAVVEHLVPEYEQTMASAEALALLGQSI